MKTNHFADRMLAAVRNKATPLIVGLDPVYENLPPALRRTDDESPSCAEQVDAMLQFSLGVLKAAAPHVAGVKINSAYFERYQQEGWEVYSSLIQEAVSMGLLVIGDVKRADIGHTAAQYAQAVLADPQFADNGGAVGPDAITVNPYFGVDGIAPFRDVADAQGKGLFVLVRTSNPSAGEVQQIPAGDGRPLYLHIADLVRQWGAGNAGTCGYSNIGAVVGATTGEAIKELRAALPQSVFLIPGVGAQGGSIADCRHALDASGFGALIAASRSIIFAYKDAKYKSLAEGDWRHAVEQAAIDTRRQIAEGLGL
ncbi:MAG: orotidine-5'-phosphate decarboxylase [Phycisphaerales bacterium]|nr:orotidine-5'-phosphate decarboxylase [Phycisphaerales bacterium]